MSSRAASASAKMKKNNKKSNTDRSSSTALVTKTKQQPTTTTTTTTTTTIQKPKTKITILRKKQRPRKKNGKKRKKHFFPLDKPEYPRPELGRTVITSIVTLKNDWKKLPVDLLADCILFLDCDRHWVFQDRTSADAYSYFKTGFDAQSVAFVFFRFACIDVTSLVLRQL